MSEIKHIIEPERMGLWVAVACILAMLALVTAVIAIHRNTELAYVTQAEMLILNKKIGNAKPEANAPALKSETK